MEIGCVKRFLIGCQLVIRSDFNSMGCVCLTLDAQFFYFFIVLFKSYLIAINAIIICRLQPDMILIFYFILIECVKKFSTSSSSPPSYRSILKCSSREIFKFSSTLRFELERTLPLEVLFYLRLWE